jgi:DNA-binding NarL/FixJ family response regulator
VTSRLDPAGRQAKPYERRLMLTLRAYIETGSHKAAAYRLGISESTSRQRVSLLLRRLGVRNATQAAWVLRDQLEAEQIERDNVA